MLDEGVTDVTDDPEVELRYVEGFQPYVVAPVAVSVAEPPAQTTETGVAVTGGSGLMETVTKDFFEQPLPSVPVTV